MTHGGSFDFGTAMTLSEWEAMPEDEPGELVDGQLVEEEVPGFEHELIVVWLTQALRAWIRPMGGYVCGSELKFGLSERRGRKPDVSLFLPETKGIKRRGAVRVPPHVMIEIVTPTRRDGRRDRVEKPVDYATFGVRYYWILDPETRTLEIFELGDDRRYVRALAAADGVIEVPGCEGLSLDLDELWREIDSIPE